MRKNHSNAANVRRTNAFVKRVFREWTALSFEPKNKRVHHMRWPGNLRVINECDVKGRLEVEASSSGRAGHEEMRREIADPPVWRVSGKRPSRCHRRGARGKAKRKQKRDEKFWPHHVLKDRLIRLAAKLAKRGERLECACSFELCPAKLIAKSQKVYPGFVKSTARKGYGKMPEKADELSPWNETQPDFSIYDQWQELVERGKSKGKDITKTDQEASFEFLWKGPAIPVVVSKRTGCVCLTDRSVPVCRICGAIRRDYDKKKAERVLRRIRQRQVSVGGLWIHREERNPKWEYESIPALPDSTAVPCGVDTASTSPASIDLSRPEWAYLIGPPDKLVEDPASLVGQVKGNGKSKRKGRQGPVREN